VCSCDLSLCSMSLLDGPEKRCESFEERRPFGRIYVWEPKSIRIRAINWFHVFRAEYVQGFHIFAALVIAVTVLSRLWQQKFWPLVATIHTLATDATSREAVAVVAVVVSYFLRRKRAVYCIENVVFVPPKDWRLSHEELNSIMRGQGTFNEDSQKFLSRMLERSGTGTTTHWPPGWVAAKDGETKVEPSVAMSRQEVEDVVFPIVREVLDKARLSPSDVDFLIVNCSLFVPTPSICAMITHHFKMRSDIRSYNLGGMGCSANVISVDLAKQLIQNTPGTRALVISTENLSQSFYFGQDKSMLLQNTLFRCGGVALVLSSCLSDSSRAKYKLQYTGRTQMNDDDSYKCVFEQQDGSGNRGIALSKDIVNVAGRAMKANFVQLAPHVLPIREQAKTIFSMMMIQLSHLAKKSGLNVTCPKQYTPDFTTGVDHFCIHAGGRAVIDGVQKNLKLADKYMQPSKDTLYEWGNTSSSSIWYELEWIERHGNLMRGDRILQVAFGSGFKCNSSVWIALRVDKTKQGVRLKGEDLSGLSDSVVHKSRPDSGAVTPSSVV